MGTVRGSAVSVSALRPFAAQVRDRHLLSIEEYLIIAVTGPWRVQQRSFHNHVKRWIWVNRTRHIHPLAR